MAKRIITAVVLFVLLAVPALFLRSPFGYFPALFFAVIIGLSFLYIWLLGRSFTFLHSSESKQCERGKEEAFPATIAGHGFLPFPRITCLFYVNDLFGQPVRKAEVDTALVPGEKRAFRFGIRFHHLGTYAVGISAVRIYDPFGFFFLPHRNPGQSAVTVRPRALPVVCFDFSQVAGHQSSIAHSRSKIESDDYSGIRAYVPGDPIKNIHWKISAHTKGYMVRMFESYTNRGFTVYLNVEATGYTREVLLDLYDCLIETAYSVACQVLQNNEDLELVYVKDGVPCLTLPRSREQLDDLLSDVGTVSVSNDGRLTDMLKANVSRQYGSDILVLCTAQVDEELLRVLASAIGLRRSVFLFYVVPAGQKGHLPSDKQDVLDALTDMGAEVFVLSKADEISETGAEAYA